MMKPIIKVFSILLCVVLLVACENFLMKSPDSNISGDEAFENFANFQGFVEELYGTLPDFTNSYWSNNWNWGDDVVTPDMNYHVVDDFDNGNFWGWQTEHNGWNTSWMDKPSSTPGGDRFNRDLWDLGWYAIRKANVGLNNLDKFQGTEAEKNLIEGQLLFFRGWYHFQFMQYFGDMPYLGDPIAAADKFDQTRIDYQALADSVASDFRRAADLLPTDWDDTAPGAQTSGNNELRVNKAAALGYLGKNLLWAASPLMNDGTDENAGSYNQEYAQRATAAFGELLSLVESGQTDHQLVPFSDWNSLFYTEGQNWLLAGGDEAIFRTPYYKGDNAQFGTAKQYMPTRIGDAGNVFPTANYAEYFGMANGLPLDAQGAGYDSEYPWRDRDPRFYKTFIYDGLEVVQANISGNEQDRYANLYTDGSWRVDGNGAGSGVDGNNNTGYVLRKFVPLSANRFDNGYSFGSNLNIRLPWMRLGGVYIMYAEAAAVANQSATGSADNFSMTAVQAINTIRDRAGVAHVDSRYLANVNDFLREVRREWTVELAFEKHRFTNLRRWLLLTDDRYADKTKIHFDRADSFDPVNPRENRVLNLRKEVIIERDYSERHYWLPLKRSDVTISESFKQNPGW